MAKRRVMTVLKAYFDESGFEGPVFTLCGYVAPEDEWKSLESEWDKLLATPCLHEIPTRRPLSESVLSKLCAPLPYLHAWEMEGLGKKRFRRIGQRNRDYLIDSSVGIITRSRIIGIGSGVVMDAYDRLPDEVKTFTGGPYLMCVRYIVSETARLSKMFLGGGDANEKIAYVFENQKTWEIEVHKLYAELKADYEQEYKMGTIAFGSKVDFTPLQAADRLAYETFKHFSEPHTDRVHWNRFLAWPQHYGKYCSEANLTELVDRLQEEKRQGSA